MPNYNCVYIIGDEPADTNIGVERIQNITSHLNTMTWKGGIQHSQYKKYYLNDTVYCIDNNGYHRCYKDFVESYSLGDKLFKLNMYTTELSLENFPGVTEYHDTRIVESTVYNAGVGLFAIECSVVSDASGNVYYQCTLKYNNEYQIPKQIYDLFNLGSPVSNPVSLDQGSRMSLSIL
jgi:hypothetical protein